MMTAKQIPAGNMYCLNSKMKVIGLTIKLWSSDHSLQEKLLSSAELEVEKKPRSK